jgi:hypothetical protein
MSDSPERIFVALASYCEPELPLTVADCLAKAECPESLRFGICHQYDSSAETEIGPELVEPFENDPQFKVELREHGKSQGGPWARNIVQGLYEGEEYTLQVDAHTRFAPGWDRELKRMYRSFPSTKPLITGFPPLYDRENGVDILPGYPDSEPVQTTIVEYWSEDGWIHHVTRLLDAGSHPRRTRVLSGAFVFTTGAWTSEVRQDPQHIYTGEEFALTLRSFTSGYDLFNPDRVVVWHRYHPYQHRDYVLDRPNGLVEARHRIAMQRLEALLEGDPQGVLEPYSLGAERDLEAYRIFSGLDCRHRTLHPDAITGKAPDPVTIRPMSA